MSTNPSGTGTNRLLRTTKDRRWLASVSTRRGPRSSRSQRSIPQGLLVMNESGPPSSVKPDLDTELEQICLQAMAKDRAQRHASMGDFAEALGVSERIEIHQGLFADTFATLAGRVIGQEIGGPDDRRRSVG